MLPALAALLPILATGYASPTPFQSLLLTTTPPSTTLADCITSAYRGQYAGQHAYVLSEECSARASLGLLDSGSLAPLPSTDADRIVWVGPSNPGSATREDMLAAWDSIDSGSSSLLATLGDDSQTSFAADAFQVALDAVPTLIHASDSGLYLSVPNSILPVLDTLLPAHMSPIALPIEPLSIPQTTGNRWGVPEHQAAHLANITQHLRFNPAIEAIAHTLSAAEILEDVRWLTGERKDSPIESRHSFHPDGRTAILWIRQQLRDVGIECSPYLYQEGFNYGILCSMYPTTDSEDHVIISAHADSRGTFGSLRAPGADDDASGTAQLLAIGRAIGKHNITFEHPVTLAFFTGEEQGLVMSNHFAQTLKKDNVTVQLNIQADMLGYRVPGEPLQLALPATIDLPEASYLVANVSQLYAPELVVGRSAACCSDHQSFLSRGFPATQVFERNGPIADPMYHNSGDLSDREGYDANQIRSIAKVTMATLFEVAGWKQG